jgi:hypothetical protein
MTNCCVYRLNITLLDFLVFEEASRQEHIRLSVRTAPMILNLTSKLLQVVTFRDVSISNFPEATDCRSFHQPLLTKDGTVLN